MQLPDLIIRGLKFGLACQKQPKSKKKQEWAMEKPKLDNARKLRDIHIIDSEDEEFKEAIKNARKILETHFEAAISCKMETRKRLKEQRKTVASGDTLTHTRKRSMPAVWKLTDLQGSAWNLLFQEITRITSPRQGLIH